MRKLKIMLGICIGLLIFLSGFLSCYAVNNVYINKESPFLIGFGSSNNQPGNWVAEKDIQVYNDKIVINVNNAQISSYADSGSMLPTLGENANGIEIKPENPGQINIGDIITFQQGNILIVHRVIDKGQDSQGFWFVTKGDNNSQTDGKVYFPDVKYVTIGLIY